MSIVILRKLYEDKDFLVFDEIRISKGGSLPLKDHRGFVIHDFMDDGNYKHKGRKVKT